jgi:hypothetical protein
MIRALRRWWLWFTHKHDWEVIWRFAYQGHNCKHFGALKRCHCGAEKAEAYMPSAWWARDYAWRPVDLQLIDAHIAWHGLELPARHKE